MTREMKDSGIKWVGKVPENWDVKPLSRFYQKRKNPNKNGLETNLLSLSYGRIIRKDINAQEGLLPENFNSYNIVEADDIIIRPTDLQNDKKSLRSGLVTEHGIITSAYLDLQPLSEVNSEFYHYLIHAYDLIKVFYNLGSGVRQSINYDEFLSLPVFEVDKEEQLAIVSFLDRKCSQIDHQIDQQEALIVELEDYKKSLITEAVTKGLDPNVEMKDSGVDWVGKIPVVWNLYPLKRICSFKTGGTPKESFGINEERDGVPWITPGELTYEHLSIKPKKYITNESVEKSKYSLFPPHTVLLTCIASIGKLGVTETPLYSNQQITSLSNIRGNERYLAYVLIAAKERLSFDAAHNVVPIINTSYLSSFKVPWPDFVEQSAIVSYLDTKCAQIDHQIEKRKELIEKLKEYKSSLIYEMVTGKREVPIDES